MSERPVRVRLTTTTEVGSCNGCGYRGEAVFNVELKNIMFRVCRECAKLLQLGLLQ